MGADPVSIGVKAALMAAQMALTMTQKIEGPRLDTLDVTTADYGTPLVRFWGIRRLEGVPIFWAEKLREKKSTSKTKGGKYSEYKYFGTFGVIIADHQIDSVSRIWLDKHLCFDLTNTGPISVLGGFFQGLTDRAVKLTMGRNMRIYKGDQTGPDPRMEAWCEDRYGADSCPAYKDVSYIVFEDIPLEKFGNRIPQVTVEAINNSNTNYLHEEEVTSGATFLGFSPDYSRLFADGSVWDTATHQRLSNLAFAPAALGTAGVVWDLYDTIGAAGGPFLVRYNGDGTSSSDPIACSEVCDTVHVFGDNEVFLGSAISNNVQQLTGITTTVTDVGFRPTAFEPDSEGNIWVSGKPAATGINLYCIDGTRQGESYSYATASSDFAKLFINSADDFVFEQNGNLYRFDSDFNLLNTGTCSATGTFSYQRGGTSFFRVTTSAVSEVSLTTLLEIRSLSQSLWSGATGNMGGGIYDPVNHAIISGPASALVWRYLDRVGSNGTDLADVVSDVAGWCGVTDFDVSDLDQVVPGYSVTQGSGKDMLSPLLDIHDVDARPHDFGVQFIKRGDAASGTIAVSEFVREGDEARYQITLKQDTDLPRKVSLSFADGDKDQQKNTVISQRPLDAVDSVRELTIDLSTYVATPGDAQKFSDRYFRRQWIGRENVSNAVTAQYLKLEPGDVWNLQLDDVTQTHRLQKMTLSQGRINLEWERDFPSLATLGTGTGAPMDGRDPDTIYVPSPTKGFVLDIPLVQDSHDLTVPQLYYAAGNYGAGDWPGASLYQADVDGDEYFAWNGVEPADKAVWGYATTALNDCDPWVWDRGSGVNVDAKGGTLTSSTEAAILASPTTNLAILGDELLNFTTATLETDGTYTLTGLLRGRRGTEWACSIHAAGDEFVLVSSLERDGMGLSDVGTALSFKAQTVGRDLESASVIDVDFGGATLKPYAPARVKWYYNGTDMIGTITRRTRVGGAWVGGTTIPLNEASEAYEVEIYSGATLKRTISVSGTNSFTYTAAMAATDGLTIYNQPTFKAYQLSDAVGRGFELAA